MGTRIVLTADRTLMSEYRNIPLLDFISCAAAEKVPGSVFYFLAPPLPNHDGVAIRAPYGIRKVEAALLRGYKPDEVVVVDPDYVERFIGPETRIVGIHTMDPLGLGPLSMMFTGGVFTSYSKHCFLDLVGRINRVRRDKGYRFKVAVGGGGGWHFEIQPKKIAELGIDHVVAGEIDHTAVDLFHQMENDGPGQLIRSRGPPKIDEIADIVHPSLHGMVEVMRGCGRNCDFCDVNLRRARYMPFEKIQREVAVNLKNGIRSAWVHSDDIFLYKLEDHRQFVPNWDAVFELFQSIMSAGPVTHANPTHGTIAPAALNPDAMQKLGRIVRGGPENWCGIQSGVETGSGRLMKSFMPLKCKPYSPDEWPDVIMNGTEAFNRSYFFPAYTMITGLPGETDDDAWDSLRLIHRMEHTLPNKVGERAHFTVTPMTFVPIGVLKGEEFFDPLRISEPQFYVVYRSWRHTLLELDHMPPSLMRTGPALKLGLHTFFRLGARVMFHLLKRMGTKLGYDVDKALDPPGIG